MSDNPARTPLYEWHASHGGRMVDFAGWAMPVQYVSIVAEHVATRTAAGLFDISHMGRLRFDGPGAAAFLDGVCTRRVLDMKPGRIRYSLITNEQGGILDDVLVYRLDDALGGSYYLLVVNAGNRQKIVDWLRPRVADAGQVQMSDVTATWAMIAVQGPRALQIVEPLVDVELAAMKYYCGVETSIAGHGGIVSRTGYTGEDGCELVVGAGAASGLWEALVERGAPLGAMPAGLGARDTLRLEAAMPLYGHELSEQIDPFQAGLDFAVDLADHAFPGRDRLVVVRDDPARPRRVGLEMSGRRAAREGYPVLVEGRQVGQVTSGTFSPTLNKPIAMAYVEPLAAQPGTRLTVDVRGQLEPAVVVELPFYRRPQ